MDFETALIAVLRSAALQGVPDSWFSPPPGLQVISVDGYTAYLLPGTAPNQPPPETFLKPQQSFAQGAGVTDVAFAADNATLYSAGLDKAVKVWKVAADAPVKNFPHPNQVYTVAFHPTAPTLASGGVDGKVRLFDLVKGAQIREINAHPKPNETMIYAVAFSPDGKQFVSAGYDNIIKLWNADTGTLIREFRTVPLRVPPQVAARMVGLMFSPHKEGPVVATWTLLANLNKKSSDRGHEDTVFSVAFSPDGKYLASGSGGLERAIKIWAPCPPSRDL